MTTKLLFERLRDDPALFVDYMWPTAQPWQLAVLRALLRSHTMKERAMTTTHHTEELTPFETADQLDEGDKVIAIEGPFEGREGTILSPADLGTPLIVFEGKGGKVYGTCPVEYLAPAPSHKAKATAKAKHK